MVVAVVQSLSHVQLFVTPWTAACQASLSFTISRSLLKLMSIWVSDAIQPSHPLLSPSPPIINLSQCQCLFQWVSFTSGGQSIGASVSASVLPVNIQGWSPLGLTGLISLTSNGLSRVFSSTTVRKLHFFGAQPPLWSNSHICTWLLRKNHSFDYMDLCRQSDVSAF